jgi:hypothetical protein
VTCTNAALWRLTAALPGISPREGNNPVLGHAVFCTGSGLLDERTAKAELAGPLFFAPPRAIGPDWAPVDAMLPLRTLSLQDLDPFCCGPAT